MQSCRKKIAIQTRHTACFADVTVRLCDSFSEPGVRLSDALPSGLGDWPEGALAGAHWALRVSNSRAAVEVVEIVGTFVDTSALTVAMASALAVWQVVGFEPPAKLVDAIDGMLRSQNR